jgi:hypothetical protein
MNLTVTDPRKLTISGNPGHDAKKYQERDVKRVIREMKK